MQSIANHAGIYRTAAAGSAALARAFPSLTFYLRFLNRVFYYSALARKGRYDDEQWCRSSLDILRALEQTGVQVEITGLHILNRVPGACVLVSNHMSTLETILLPGVVQPIKDVTFVIKRGIAEYPVFKHIILSRNPIVVDRASPRDDLTRVLDEGSHILESGRSIIVFPQTTRNLVFDPEQFNSIGVKLAKRTGAPVIPVAVKSDAWGIGRLVKEFGRIDPSKRVHFAFGEPITVEGRGQAEHAAVIDFICARLTSWCAQVR
jgi:1-acyl-sn-glycerol-3-phosphate acyltransferase